METSPRRRGLAAALLTGALVALGAPTAALAIDDQLYVAPNAPRIGAGFASIEGTADCDPCVQNLEAQLTGAGNLGLNRISRRFRIADPTRGLYGALTHNQGVAALRDGWVVEERYARTAITFNANDDTGLLVASRNTLLDGNPTIDGGHGGLDYGAFDWTGFLRSSDPLRFWAHEGLKKQFLRIQNVPAYGNHSHPGGISAQGDVMAIAMEEPKGPDKRAAVYFVRVDGTTPHYVSTVWLGGNPAGTAPSLTSAATVGFTRRAGGGFVLAVSGKTNGRGGVWWYVTDDAAITPTTTWRYVDFWEPNAELPGKLCDIEGGKHSINCFVGGGGATSLVTGCDGQLYLTVLTGTDSIGKDDEYAQIFRVSQDETGEVHLAGVWSSKRGPLGLTLVNDIAFRWGAGANVLPGGRLALLSTERRTRQDDNDWVDGFMRIGGSNTQGP